MQRYRLFCHSKRLLHIISSLGLQQLVETIQPLVTCLQSKLAGVYFKFEKIEEIIDIDEETCEKTDGWFQSVYAEAVSMTNKLCTEEEWPRLCRKQINWNKISSEEVKQNWQRSVYLLVLKITFHDMKPLPSQKKKRS